MAKKPGLWANIHACTALGTKIGIDMCDAIHQEDCARRAHLQAGSATLAPRDAHANHLAPPGQPVQSVLNLVHLILELLVLEQPFKLLSRLLE